MSASTLPPEVAVNRDGADLFAVVPSQAGPKIGARAGHSDPPPASAKAGAPAPSTGCCEGHGDRPPSTTRASFRRMMTSPPTSIVLVFFTNAVTDVRGQATSSTAALPAEMTAASPADAVTVLAPRTRPLCLRGPRSRADLVGPEAPDADRVGRVATVAIATAREPVAVIVLG